MPCAYILRGSTGRHYIGSTTDLERRLSEHQRGHTHTTQRLGDELQLIASLDFARLEDARAFERELKRKKNPKLAIHLLLERKAQAGT